MPDDVVDAVGNPYNDYLAPRGGSFHFFRSRTANRVTGALQAAVQALPTLPFPMIAISFHRSLLIDVCSEMATAYMTQRPPELRRVRESSLQ